MVTPAEVVHFLELKRRVTELKEELEKKELQLQSLASLAKEITTLRFKVPRVLVTTARLQTKSNGVFMVMDEIRALYNMKRGVVTEMTNLKQREFKLKTELR